MKAFKIILLLTLNIVAVSCVNTMNDKDLTSILNIDSIEVISKNTTSVPNLWVIEYDISEKSKSDYLKNEKKFPYLKGYETWNKVGWLQSSSDTIPNGIGFYLDIYWDKHTEKKQGIIKEALRKQNTYFAYYYKGDSPDSWYRIITLYVFDTQDNILYEVGADFN